MKDLLKRFRYAAIRLWVALPRLRTLLIPTAGILATLGVLAPAAAADDTDDYKPGGIGDMMPSPFKPPGQGTLFETYSPEVYQLDKQLSDDLTGGDLIDGWLHGFGNMLMQVLTLVGRARWWWSAGASTSSPSRKSKAPSPRRSAPPPAR